MAKNYIWNGDNGDGTYSNPILYTDYSDPDVIRVGKDYYMVASSFCNTPALPVLHSNDLVNWEMCSYVLDQIDEPGYDKPRHGCGVWAPAIRYHEGYFMVYYPMPDEGIFMSKAKDAKGPWSEPVCVHRASGWIDPCPFWDDDGKAYLVTGVAKSRIGYKSVLHLSPMTWDGTALLDEGQHIFDGHLTQPTIEGPKMYKRNGYYYILAPAGSVKSGWQTALRSKNIYGPYEERIVMMQSGTKINGPHQGGWVDTPSGEDWFIHFQDVGNAGRIIHLQPMKWVNDWPVIGQPDSEEGFGVPVASWKKPDVGGSFPEISPADSDDFAGDSFGLQWQWNANHKEDWFAMEHPGLCLFAQKKTAALCDMPNLFLQKWTAPGFSFRVTLDISKLQEGDVAGIVSLGRLYTSLAVEKKNGLFTLAEITGHIGAEEEKKTYGAVGGTQVKMGMEIYADGTGQFFFPDVMGVWRPAGEKITFTAGYWVGVKYGLFALHEGEGSGGCVKATDFIVSREMLER